MEDQSSHRGALSTNIQNSDGSFQSVSEAVSSQLNRLKPDQAVAVVSMLGSFCPITLAHTQSFVEARHILLGESKFHPSKLMVFSEVLGFIALNGDSHVSAKLRAKGEEALNKKVRSKLVELATEDFPWLTFCYLQGEQIVKRFSKLWPHLQFIHFTMNGADDVVRYQKWLWASPTNRMITMGRRGFTQQVLTGMRNCGLDPETGEFIVGPQIMDISSSEVRSALRDGELSAVAKMLHPKVRLWLIQNHSYSTT